MAKKATEQKNMDFESGIARLGEVLAALEKGDAGLEASMMLYEEGISLVRACTGLLENAEQRIKALQINADGVPTLEDFRPGKDD